MYNLDSVKSGVESLEGVLLHPSILTADMSAVEGEGYTMSNLIVDAIEGTHKTLGLELNEGTVNKALAAVDKVVSGFSADAIGSTKGREVVAQTIGVHIISAISANLPFSGNIATFVSDGNTGAGGSTKAKIYYTIAKANKSIGDIEVGDSFDGIKALTPYASMAREETMITTTGITTYSFNLKVKTTDSANFKMEIGRNSVMVAGVELDDYEADSSAKKTNRNKEVDGVTYDAEFDYALGTIVLNLSAAADGDTVAFSASLDRTDLTDIVGQMATDIQDDNYTTKPLYLDIVTNALDIRETFANTGIDLKANSFGKAIEKILHEILGSEITAMRGLAVAYGNTIDIVGNQRDTIAETYKPIVMHIDTARAEMITDSGQAGNITLIGGVAVEKIISALSLDSGNGVGTRSKSFQNLVRHVGDIRQDISGYFDPTHDAKYPQNEDGEEVIFVVNTPTEDLKKPILSGIALPVLPEGDIRDLTGSDKIRLSGTFVASRNKNSRLSKQVKKITVRI